MWLVFVLEGETSGVFPPLAEGGGRGGVPPKTNTCLSSSHSPTLWLCWLEPGRPPESGLQWRGSRFLLCLSEGTRASWQPLLHQSDLKQSVFFGSDRRHLTSRALAVASVTVSSQTRRWNHGQRPATGNEMLFPAAEISDHSSRQQSGDMSMSQDD